MPQFLTIDKPATAYDQRTAARMLAELNGTGDDWTYKASEPNNAGLVFIEVYDENDEFVCRGF